MEVILSLGLYEVDMKFSRERMGFHDANSEQIWET
jgi:hypothetical protein